MKILTISPVKNEEFILPFFLDHYTALGDVVLFDNGSTDGTIDIAKSYPNVSIVYFDTQDKLNDYALTEIRNKGWVPYKDSYDYCIVVDSDQIIYHPNLKDYLQKCFNDGMTFLGTVGYQMLSEELPRYNGTPIYEQIRTGAEYWTLSIKPVFNPKKVSPSYDHGQHSAFPKGEVVSPEETELKTLHYRWLSYDYFMSKCHVRNSELSDWNKAVGAGVHYSPYLNYSKSDYTTFVSKAVDVVSGGQHYERRIPHILPNKVIEVYE